MENLQKEKETPKIVLWIAVMVLMYMMLASCTKRVFVGDSEAIRWRVLYETCQMEKSNCVDLLNECVEVGDSLLNCP